MTHPAHEPSPCDVAPTVSVEVLPGPQRTTARIIGEIDADNQPGVRADLTAALEASASGLDLDLSALTFCDSAGVHLLLDLDRQAATTEKTLVLDAVPAQLGRLLDITGTLHTFTIRPAQPAPHRDGRPSAGRCGGAPPADSHEHRPAYADSVIAFDDEP
ncbi:STAS domain-containing protein [Streptomyces sp. cmx-4-9]|uniref:STAS domain-containing protein n=1 Tax=Streptomyces sp. cmx-4-9 TaxID=2790941 RepID=UPI00397F6129